MAKQAAPPVDEDDTPPTLMEEIVFNVRQYLGIGIVLIGCAVMLNLLPLQSFGIERGWYPIISLGIVCVGGVIHEFRPFKRMELIQQAMAEREEAAAASAASKKAS